MHIFFQYDSNGWLLLKIILFTILVLVLLFAFEHIMRKVLRIKKQIKQKDIGRLVPLGTFIIAIAFTVYTIVYTPEVKDLFIPFALLIILSCGWDAFLKWKFFKDSREHVISILTGIFLLVLLIIAFPFIMP